MRILLLLGEYWKHFVARLNGVHAFGYNSAGSEPICMKFGALWVHCLPLALAYFGRDTRKSESERASRFFVFIDIHRYALLRRIAPRSVVCRSVCRSVSLSH